MSDIIFGWGDKFINEVNNYIDDYYVNLSYKMLNGGDTIEFTIENVNDEYIRDYFYLYSHDNQEKAMEQIKEKIKRIDNEG